MDVSIIIPIYKGNGYIESLLNKIEMNYKLSQKEIEVIFVNDYPDEEIIVGSQHDFPIRIINNEMNQGIHQTRINGLKKALGKYILFLDQDDEISDNFIKSQLEHIGEADLCIANGIMESENGKCLIKKTSIPEYWTKNIMSVNSADDYFLWLLMIENKCQFNVNHDVLYTHKYTGENVSGSIDQVHKSNMEMVDLLKEYCHNINVDLLKRTITYKYIMKKQGKLVPSIKNIDLFLYNTIYQLLWKGM